MKRLALCFLIAATLPYVSVQATEPTTRPDQTGTGVDLQHQAQGGPLSFPEQMISGNVADFYDRPLGGVAIKLFAGGTLVHVGQSNASGGYEIPLPLNIEKDETVVLWFISTDRPLLPQRVVLKQSSYAKKNQLFSPCAIEVKMRPQMRLDVKLLDESQELAALKAKGCL